MTLHRSLIVAALMLPAALPAQTKNPQPAFEPRPGVYKSKGTVAGVTINITATIEDEKNAWKLTEVTETPGGVRTATSTLEKKTLNVQSYSQQQGQASVKIAIVNNKASGTMDLGTRQAPVTVDLTGPIFGGYGPAGDHVIAQLPLADGYNATFQTLDLQRQLVLDAKVTVEGSEKITVPAGEFDTYRVAFSIDNNSGNTTLWIAKDLRRPVKVSTLRGSTAIVMEAVP